MVCFHRIGIYCFIFNGRTPNDIAAMTVTVILWKRYFLINFEHSMTPFLSEFYDLIQKWFVVLHLKMLDPEIIFSAYFRIPHDTMLNFQTVKNGNWIKVIFSMRSTWRLIISNCIPEKQSIKWDFIQCGKSQARYIKHRYIACMMNSVDH